MSAPDPHCVGDWFQTVTYGVIINSSEVKSNRLKRQNNNTPGIVKYPFWKLSKKKNNL